MPAARPLPFPVIFAGSGIGEVATVRAYDADTGVERFAVRPFGPDYRGGVRVTAGDVTGDGIPDAVVAPASGRVPSSTRTNGTRPAAGCRSCGCSTAAPARRFPARSAGSWRTRSG